MTEDAGKKKFIKDFLQKVRGGEGFIEDIWVERIIKTPGLIGEGSTARSLSGRSISNITELLEDDLKHSFDDGYFTFRIVSALKGSGKTSLLTYLHELSKTKLTYKKFSVISRFPFTNINAIGGSYDFSVKFYCYILAETFWKLISDSELSVTNTAKTILSDYLEQSEVTQLITATRLETFRPKFIRYFATVPIVFEEFFFEVIDKISQVEPRYTFAYLLDEFDALEKRSSELQQTLSIIRALIKRAAQEFGSKLHLFIYLVGTSENIKSLFSEDPIIESLVGHQVITLNAGYRNEFETIKAKIDERLKGAFGGYKGFENAWQEIKSIPLRPAQTLRGFCQEYAATVLVIYEKYFKEEPEKGFEGNARDLVKAQCNQQWQGYLNQRAYTLSLISTTTKIAGHAFDCYVELLHNSTCVARCFGEAKNYELLSSHLETFTHWLKDVSFKPSATNGTPPDLAFMIAPSCPSLLQRKLELKNIQFIPSHKVVPIKTVDPNPPIKQKISVDINAVDKNSLISAFKGTGIRQTAIDKLINSRPCNNLDDLAAKIKLNSTAKAKLEDKLSKGEISFG